MKTTFKMLVATASLLLAANAYAAAPVFKAVPGGAVIGRVSNNGLWGVSENGGETEDGQLFSAGGALWDLSTMKATSIAPANGGHAGLTDVTDDGKVVVGSYGDKPAIWSAETNAWTILPLPEGTISGGLLAVTPDGSRAVGYANRQTEWDAVPVAYDLKSQTIINLPNVPTKDMDHQETEIGIFCDISADGRYILGRLSMQMLLPISMCAYVYDTTTDTYDFIGFTPNDRRPWTPHYKDCLFVSMVEMSPDGKFVSGSAYIGKKQEGSDFLEEYYTAFKYEVASKKFEVYDGVYDSDASGFAITDNGTVLAAMPAENPYSFLSVRSGNYYYSFDEICRQAYGFDFNTTTGRTNSGKPLSISGDGKVLSMLAGPGDCYIMHMTDNWEDVTVKVNLLNNFTVTPASGSTFSALSEVSLNFAREVGLSAAASRVKLVDSEGKTLQTALAAEAEGRTVTLRFRPTDLEAGKSYSVVIPQGFVTMIGDANVSSNAIEISYTGRREGAVAPTLFQPADGATFSRLDASTNCIFAQFDADLKVAEGARAYLMRAGSEVPVAELDVALFNSSTLVLYPLSRQYLYDGTDYRVVIPAGVVTDLSGRGANEEITLNYHGNYVREVSSSDKYIFQDACQNYDGFMFFDGDRRDPGSVPYGWGFTAENPWILIRDSETSSDMALAAHSMFAAAGKADDWAVTPQLYIPDSNCYLQFEAQSYLKSKADRLKVYAYVSENGYSTLSQEIVDDIRANGKLIFDRQLSAGNNDETTEGEWTTYTVLLPEFAEKSVYFAFVNDNEDQSAVFIHRVEVVHDMQFLTSITSPVTVVDAKSAPVAGTVTFISDILTASSIELTLNDSEGKAVSSVKESGLDLAKGKSFNFAFAEPLPLKPTAANRFTISIVINDSIRSSVSGTVKNLAFSPVRRVVLEEYSGRDCSNCPRGFVAMENLERIYPGRIIPIVLRTYEDDPLGSGMGAYTNFLGINNLGAPSAVVNRNWYCYPMTAVGNDYRFSGDGTDEVTWLDAVAAEMAQLPDADITFSPVFDGETGKITIDGATRFALNSSRNVNLFTVVLENKLHTEQSNGMRYFDDPDLGEWGKGGIYAQGTVDYIISHVGRGSFGTTFNGTPGMVPAIQNAGTENPFNFSVTMPETVSNVFNTDLVVMMIDSDNDRLINANIAPISVVNVAINEVSAEPADAPVEYFNLQGRRVAAPAKGQLLIKRQGSKTSKILF